MQKNKTRREVKKHEKEIQLVSGNIISYDNAIYRLQQQRRFI